jgi:hypothetical protein
MAPKTPASDQQITDGEESSTKDQTTGDVSGVEKTKTAGGEESEETGEEESTEETVSEEEATELISKKQFDALKSDPEKLHKELVKAANKKFREVSDQRKSLQPYSDFIKALDTDPRKAVAALAVQLGMKIEGTESVKEATEDVQAKLTETVKKALGPDFEDLADRLIPAISAVADSMVQKALKPVLDKQDEIIVDAAAKSSEAAMLTFAKTHPGWEKHEEAMVELSKRLPPGEGMSEPDYLDAIYYLVTSDKSEGSAVKKTVDRMKQAARDSNADASVSSDKVALRGAKLPTFREAAEAAKRGERLE